MTFNMAGYCKYKYITEIYTFFFLIRDWTLPILDEVTCLCQGIIVTNGRIHYLQSQVTVEHVAKGVFTGNSEQWLPLLAVGNLALNCWPTGHRYITVYQQSAGSVNVSRPKIE